MLFLKYNFDHHNFYPQTIVVHTLQVFTELRRLTQNKHNLALFVLASVLLAVPTPLDCRRQAFPFQNIPVFRQVCAVPVAAVR